MARSKRLQINAEYMAAADQSSETHNIPCQAGANHTRIKVRAIGREVQAPTAMRLEGGCGLAVAVGGEIVENDRGAGCDLGDQHLADIGGESGAVHCTFDHPGCDEGIRGQPAG